MWVRTLLPRFGKRDWVQPKMRKRKDTDKFENRKRRDQKHTCRKTGIQSMMKILKR